MKLVIPKHVEEKIHAYVMSVDSEIAGMGKVTVDGDIILVSDVMIYEQEVTGATADLSSKAIAKWMLDLVKAGESPKDWRLWFHSHDTMSAFFSKTDTDTMDRQTESDWIISLVVNKRRERKARLDTYRPFRMYMNDVDIEIEGSDFIIPADIALEVAEKVKQKKYQLTGYKGTGYTGKIGFNRESEQYTNVSMLEKQVREFKNKGKGGTSECLDAMVELVDALYELSSAEPVNAIANEITKKAQKLEADIYGLTHYV